MKDAIIGLLASKKFLTMIVGLAVTLTAKLGWNVDSETIWQVVTIVAAGITGQGLADLGKERAKADAVATAVVTPGVTAAQMKEALKP